MAYILAEPFLIDNGELDGIAPDRAFVLGAEFVVFLAALKAGDPFSAIVHAANGHRLRMAALRRGWKVAAQVCLPDGWLALQLEPRGISA